MKQNGNDNHRDEKNIHLKAFSGTIVSAAIIIVSMIFISFKPTIPPFEEKPVFIDVSNIDLSDQLSGEGEMAALGETDYGAPGTNTGIPPNSPQNTTSTTTTPGGQPTNDRMMTQETEDVAITAPKGGNSTKPKTDPPRQPNPRFSFSQSTNPNPGQGTGTTPGFQGSSTGNPNSDNFNPNGGAGGTGTYQLGNRKVKQRAPIFQDNTQKVEKIVIAITVDRKGNVIFAEPTFKNGGSTVIGPLVDKAIEASKKVKFDADPTAPEEQYGTITFNFKLQ